MRTVIVGAGVVGLLTALACVREGHEVVLIDRGSIPNPRAASFDAHRVMRALHPGDPASTAAAVRAHRAWASIQRELSTACYAPIGVLTAMPGDQLANAAGALAAAGTSSRVLMPGAPRAWFPHVGFAPEVGAVIEAHTGVLLADRALHACARRLRRHPRAQLLPNRAVVDVDADRPAVTLAGGECVTGDALLLALGAWSRALLPADIAEQLVLHRQSMLYCKAPTSDAKAWAATPSIASLGRPGGPWLVPPIAGTPLKLSAATARREVAEFGDPATPATWRAHLTTAFSTVIPGFDVGWVTGARDYYYLAQATTGDPLVVRLGEHAVSLAACGGASFKFAPLIARSLSARLAGVQPAPTGLGWLDTGVLPGRALSLMRGVS